MTQEYIWGSDCIAGREKAGGEAAEYSDGAGSAHPGVETKVARCKPLLHCHPLSLSEEDMQLVQLRSRQMRRRHKHPAAAVAPKGTAVTLLKCNPITVCVSL